MMDQLYLNGEHMRRDLIMLAAVLFAEDGQTVQTVITSCLLAHCIFIDPICLFAVPCVLGLAQAKVSTEKPAPSSWRWFGAKWLTRLMGILAASQVSRGMYYTLLELLSPLTQLRVGWMQWALPPPRSLDWAGYLEMLCDVWLGCVAYAVATIYGVFVPSRDPGQYSASLGVRWYLDAQMLPEYTVYFDSLLALQPLICAILVHARIAPKNPSVAVHVMMAVVILFSRDLAAADVLLAACLLAQHTAVVSQMRQLPWILIGISLPLVLTPVMLKMWIEYGTGNANYCFFQGICLWLFFALGVGEFCIAFMKVHSTPDTDE
jgi:hypothetical protein